MTTEGRTAPETGGMPGVLPPPRRIFTNRNLRMSSIEAIGFDMDHTLAVYNQEPFARLCFDLAVELLVERKGYPERILELPYEPANVIRGLVVDKRLGNILKVDNYNYVSRVRHGTRFQSRDERRAAYKRGRISSGRERYRVFDTLFDLPEGCLYTALVDLKDADPRLIRSSYRILFNDIREAVDTIHRDGTLKRRIVTDLDRYFIKDPDLAPTLRMFREADKRLFLLTNSELDYTAAVMDHLLNGESGSWEDLFDLVICSAGKPGYFVSRGGGKPAGRDAVPHLANAHGNCYTAGDAFFLESKIGSFGDAILYFGDHTYGDILRSKKSVGWRTAMIIPEVEGEVEVLLRNREGFLRLAEVEHDLEYLVNQRDNVRARGGRGRDRRAKLDEAIGGYLAERSALQRRLIAAFNPLWGSLLKEGRAASRLGGQVADFACIYTSRVSNFLHYPVDKFFAKPTEYLPHERGAISGS